MDQLNSSLSDAKMLKDPLVKNCYLATAGDNGHPSVRIITVHEVEDKGLFFIASKSSGKTIQINENIQVGLCFYWQALSLQVTVEGLVEATDDKTSEILWAKRDHHVKITALAFDLAEDKMGKDKLDYYKKKTRDNFQESLPPLVKSWSGFLIRPTRIEFLKMTGVKINAAIVTKKRECMAGISS
jgi:pyridoxamine 5'-phosphate oxidase